jgi:hypothetical protein
MTLSSIITLIMGVLQFPSAVSALIKTLRQTPAEQQDALIKTMLAEADNFQKTGRPSWQ